MQTLTNKIRTMATATLLLLLGGKRKLMTFNNELGLFTWNVLAWLGCGPGVTEFCKQACYAQCGQFAFSDVRAAQLARLQMAHKHPEEFRRLMTIEARTKARLSKRSRCHETGRLVIRLHSAGDIATLSYLRLLHQLALDVPEVTWLVFTRSWRVPSMRAALYEYAALDNVALLCSIDPTHDDRPPRLSPVNGKRLKRAYVEGCADAPKPNCKKQLEHGTCESCGRCWLGRFSDVTLQVHGAGGAKWLKAQ